MMPRTGLRVMVVDDEEPMLEWLSIFLEQAGYHVDCYSDGRAALDAGEASHPDVLVVDIKMPGISGLEVFSRLKEQSPDIVGIVMTAYSSVETAVTAIRHGASDYLLKPFQADQLLLAIEKALGNRRIARENVELRRRVRRDFDFSRIVGKSRPVLELLEQIRVVAGKQSTVLITGESGTGKELVARAIHHNSSRADGPFMGVSCGSFSRNLLESELFGHRKGAFTGAHRDKDGLLVSASGGTFFLDEIGELDRELQVKLLRALQERQVRPVGATRTVPFDTRIVAATNRDLQEMVDNGDFRSDLYYRLNVIPLKVPALRERRGDIPHLIRHFIDSREGVPSREFTDQAVEALGAYRWPGNVRELENLVERLCVMSASDVIDASDLPEYILSREETPSAPGDAPCSLPEADAPPATLREMEKAWILYVLEHRADGQKRRAAKLLGINESTLHRKLDRYLGEDD
jgi:DNA-binding NtrC family response regulator